MKVNLLKKELVVGTIFLLLLATMPQIVCNGLPFATAYTDDLVVKVTTDKNKYDIGEPVEVTINVTNNGYEDVTLVFPDTQLADFSVNHYLYLWSYDKVFIPMITPKTIPSGETVELLNDYWNQVDISGNQVPKGVYHIDGWMVEGIGHPEIHGDPVFITIGEYSPELEITKVKGGIFSFTIKNVGDETAINVSWSIRFDGGIVHPREQHSFNNNNLAPDEERTIVFWLSPIPEYSQLVFGIGRVKITMVANADNAEKVTKTTDGFIILLFVIIR